ncbi:terpene synthase family protein [Streptomyces mobaraensis]|uniref:Terpene synthase n=1 Tax=Streptomyces mobaraensis TaxID=35621 RepID=A0A5N5W9J0_STRMB|nr:hypothetical protein [Streptomyces mobaraensis]KAB7846953.1 hypothetical protein FRZ00_12185 [Streptomyces mobaraensis]
MTLDPVPDDFLTFYCPIPGEVGPDGDKRVERTLAWVRSYDFGSGDDMANTMYAHTGVTLVTHLFPHATGDLAQALDDYNTWAFLANDLTVPDHRTVRTTDAVRLIARWTQILRIPHIFDDTSPDEAALGDALSRLRQLTTPVQFDRFAKGQARWLWGQAWEAHVREHDSRMTVNEHLTLGYAVGGPEATPPIVEVAEGIEVPERELASLPVRAAVDAAMTTAVFDNQRYSYFKESAHAQPKRSMFDTILRNNPGRTLQEAMHEGVAIRDRALACYLRLRDRILPHASPQLRQYLAGLDLVLSGHLTFAAKALRYLTPGRTVTITPTPPPQLPTEPLPYPAVAWWWDQIDPHPARQRDLG